MQVITSVFKDTFQKVSDTDSETFQENVSDTFFRYILKLYLDTLPIRYRCNFDWV